MKAKKIYGTGFHCTTH